MYRICVSMRINAEYAELNYEFAEVVLFCGHGDLSVSPAFSALKRLGTSGKSILDAR